MISFPHFQTGRKLAKLRYSSSAQSVGPPIGLDDVYDIQSLGQLFLILSVANSSESESQLNQLGTLCCQVDSATRPNISEILKSLNAILILSPHSVNP